LARYVEGQPPLGAIAALQENRKAANNCVKSGEILK
jgi:hypothetical protein